MTTKPKQAKKTYFELSAQLDDLLLWFESESIDLDEAIIKYEQAMGLITELETYLSSAENKVIKIKARFDQ